MRACPRCRAIYSSPEERCGADGVALVETDEDPLVGHTLDRYRVLECVGQGAMGSVYRAEHTGLGSECALKILYGNLRVNPRLLERFRREAMAIHSMRHPNVVSVSDFGSTREGLTFFVMEMVHGRTLERTLAAEGRLAPARAANLLRQMASGIEEAHARGFVHRDLKPANVMLAPVRHLELVKILDFGVVGLVQSAHQARLTAAGHIVGTPTYMAPEQARGASTGPPADLYALGVILYEMLSGLPPFTGSGIAEVLIRHVTERPAPIGPHEGLGPLALRLLEKRPEDRPASARAVIEAIDALELGAQQTQQVLVADVQRYARAVRRGDQDEEWIEPTVLKPDRSSTDEELERPETSTDEGRNAVERDTLDLPAERAGAGSDERTQPPDLVVDAAPPGEHDRTVPTPALVAPPLLHPPITRADLEAPTALDFPRDRPPIVIAPSESEVVSSASIADTAPPAEPILEERAPAVRDSLVERSAASRRLVFVLALLLLLATVGLALYAGLYRN